MIEFGLESRDSSSITDNSSFTIGVDHWRLDKEAVVAAQADVRESFDVRLLDAQSLQQPGSILRLPQQPEPICSQIERTTLAAEAGLVKAYSRTFGRLAVLESPHVHAGANINFTARVRASWV
jgi:hypothetical protein